jgi:hypothetical protein
MVKKTDNDILINILLDRSGSMGGYEKDVIGHFNAYIDEQKELPGKATVSLVLFDDRYEQVYLGKDIAEVPALTKDTYYVRGSTAYLDALGRLVKSVDALTNKPKKVVFVINTDGYENASREFNRTQIKEIITERTNNHDWQFVFIGAGIDAFESVKDLGFNFLSVHASPSNANGGVEDSYNNLSRSTTNYRSGVTATMDFTNPDDDEDKTKKVTTGR